MKESFSYIDISPTISPRIGVFPGDTAFRRKVLLDTTQGQNITLSAIHSTLHLGAHVDAPNHYHEEGVGISDRSLHFYLGRAQVITVKVPRGGRVVSEMIKEKEILAPRVLFRTDSFPDPENWNSDFAALSADLVHYLADKNVRMIGIDTPSIDLEKDQVLQSHKAVYERQMAILEGIILRDAPDGIYTLVALPLKLEDADASPVRAILLTGAETLF